MNQMTSEHFSQLMSQIHHQQIKQQREISQVININPQINNILYPNQLQFQPYFYFFLHFI